MLLTKMPIITVTYYIFISLISLGILKYFVISIISVFVRNIKDSKKHQYINWPSVCIQCPIHNERYVVKRLIRHLAKINYPKSKLSIYILNESSDETTKIIEKDLYILQKHGFSAKLITTSKKQGGKAELLNLGLAITKSAFICVLDADFVPTPTFLIDLIPHILSNKRIGAVQARWEFSNYNSNVLTRAQSLWGDYHFITEKPVYNFFHAPIYSNGSGIIIRRECIIDCGGWPIDTPSEDLDISYQAQDRGWTFVYVPQVKIDSELPERVSSLKMQQIKWTYSTIKILRKKEGQLQNRGKRIAKLANYFISYMSAIIIITLTILLLPMSILNIKVISPLLWIVFVVTSILIICFITLYNSYQNWFSRLLFSPTLIFLIIGMSMSIVIGVIQGFSQYRVSFTRTPKSVPPGQTYELNYYPSWFRLIELIPITYLTISLGFAIKNQSNLMSLIIFFYLGFCFIFLCEIMDYFKISKI